MKKIGGNKFVQHAGKFQCKKKYRTAEKIYHRRRQNRDADSAVAVSRRRKICINADDKGEKKVFFQEISSPKISCSI